MEREVADHVEQEVKLVTEASIGDLVRAAWPERQDGWAFVSFPPRGVQDIYFDTPDFALAQQHQSVRARKRRINKGWSINYKGSPLDSSDAVTHRREVVSNVRVDELVSSITNGEQLPGKAWDLAITSEGHQLLRPVAYVATVRHIVALRPGGDLGERMNNVILLLADSCAAMKCDKDQAISVATNGGPIWHGPQRHELRWDMCEIEVGHHLFGSEEGPRVLERVAGTLIAQVGGHVTKQSKYGFLVDQFALC